MIGPAFSALLYVNVSRDKRVDLTACDTEEVQWTGGCMEVDDIELPSDSEEADTEKLNDLVESDDDAS